MNYPIRSGLLEHKDDPRDFALGAFYANWPTLAELPRRFELEGFRTIRDQGDDDHCTGHAFTGLSELQEGVELNPDYAFAASKELSGDLEAFGQDMRTAAAAQVKYGTIEQVMYPWVEEKDEPFLRRFANWPKHLRVHAWEHKKGSYFQVVGPYTSHFDNIRAAMYKFRDKRQGVALGFVWGWDLELERIDNVQPAGFAHAVFAFGWDGDYLLIQNSAGKKAGDNGVHRVHRSVVNFYVDRYRAWMLQDATPEEVKWYIENGIKVDQSWLWQFILLIRNYLKW